MPSPLIRSGYDVSILLRVRVDGANEDLSAATISASLVSADKTSELIADTAQSSGATGASWADGLVAVVFPAASTTSLAIGTGNIELAIVKASVRLPCESIPVRIEKGWTLT